MGRKAPLRTTLFLLPALLLATGPATGQPGPTSDAGYAELVRLFRDWRTFQRPARTEGIPDYTAAAMAAQHRGLDAYRHRLAALDPTGWRSGVLPARPQ